MKKIVKRKSVFEKPEKLRLAIECSPEERKFMKTSAACMDKTLNEFVLECVRLRIYKCSHPHTPNKKTVAVLKTAEMENDLIHFDSAEGFLKSLKK